MADSYITLPQTPGRSLVKQLPEGTHLSRIKLATFLSKLHLMSSLNPILQDIVPDSQPVRPPIQHLDHDKDLEEGREVEHQVPRTSLSWPPSILRRNRGSGQMGRSW